MIVALALFLWVSSCWYIPTKSDASEISITKEYGTSSDNNALIDQIIASQVSRERRMRDLRKIIEKKIDFDVKFSGLFRSAIYYDTRQVFGELDNYEMFLPAEAAIDRNGQDVNVRGSQNIVPADSRFIMTVLGPKVSGAITWGMLEADFLGVGNTIDFSLAEEFNEGTVQAPLLNRLFRNQIANRFNVRRLFFRLDWEHMTVIIGQEFHPFIMQSAPEVLAYNTGSPFESDSQSAQLRLTMRSKHFELQLAAVSERQFLHTGPTGPTSEYYRDSLSPSLDAQMRCFFGNHMIGGGIDYKRLTPRLLTFGIIPVIVSQEERDYASIAGVSATVYGQFQFSSFEINTKLNYLQNAANFQMLSGYAVHSICEDSDKRTYTNLTAVTIWAEFVVPKTIEPALFVAYGKTLGANDTIITSRFTSNDLVYALFPNVDQAWRISPRIQWHNEPIVIGFEMEYTGTIYGRLSNSGKIVDKQPSVHNIRFLAVFDYYF